MDALLQVWPLPSTSPAASMTPPFLLPAAGMALPFLLPAAGMAPPFLLPAAGMAPPFLLPAADMAPPFLLLAAMAFLHLASHRRMDALLQVRALFSSLLLVRLPLSHTLLPRGLPPPLHVRPAGGMAPPLHLSDRHHILPSPHPPSCAPNPLTLPTCPHPSPPVPIRPSPPVHQQLQALQPFGLAGASLASAALTGGIQAGAAALTRQKGRPGGGRGGAGLAGDGGSEVEGVCGGRGRMPHCLGPAGTEDRGKGEAEGEYLMVQLRGGLNQMRAGVSGCRVASLPTKLLQPPSFISPPRPPPCPSPSLHLPRGGGEDAGAIPPSSSHPVLPPCLPHPPSSPVCWQICDAVVVAKMLGATLVLPLLDNSSWWADGSTFSDVFDAPHFIRTLAPSVRVVPRLPATLRDLPPVVRTVPKASSPDYYLKHVRPLLSALRDLPPVFFFLQPLTFSPNTIASQEGAGAEAEPFHFKLNYSLPATALLCLSPLKLFPPSLLPPLYLRHRIAQVLKLNHSKRAQVLKLNHFKFKLNYSLPAPLQKLRCEANYEALHFVPAVTQAIAPFPHPATPPCTNPPFLPLPHPLPTSCALRCKANYEALRFVPAVTQAVAHLTHALTHPSPLAAYASISPGAPAAAPSVASYSASAAGAGPAAAATSCGGEEAGHGAQEQAAQMGQREQREAMGGTGGMAAEGSGEAVKYVALHLRYEPDMLAFTGCDYGGGRKERRLLEGIRKRWPELPRQNPKQQRAKGKCLVTPSQFPYKPCPPPPSPASTLPWVALVLQVPGFPPSTHRYIASVALQALGFPSSTRLYIASGELHGGPSALLPLLKAFPFATDKYSLARSLAPARGKEGRVADRDVSSGAGGESGAAKGAAVEWGRGGDGGGGVGGGVLEGLQGRKTLLAAVDYEMCRRGHMLVLNNNGNMAHLLSGHRSNGNMAHLLAGPRVVGNGMVVRGWETGADAGGEGVGDGDRCWHSRVGSTVQVFCSSEARLPHSVTASVPNPLTPTKF
ncbi:unnamed protein product [Closterium sp. Naga37s-1]|nr:unnamed protein product [Closterium sp. Naga37s-1]